MKIGVLTTQPFPDQSLEEVLEYLSDMGVECVELSCGGFLGSTHMDPEKALEDKSERRRISNLLKEYDMEISAISAHGNPIHPQEEKAETYDNDLRTAIELASKLDVGVVNGFSGCPGASEDAKHPNWITFPWPGEHTEALEWQWEECIIPYWTDLSEFADEKDVDIGIEMHPNMSVYNPETMIKLREETNDRIGANFDPSHLYWQGIDVLEAIQELGERDAIKHFHAKDTRIYDHHRRLNGVLDAKPLSDIRNRAWNFRSVGYGHGESHWKDIISTLRLVGYDDVLSIEHEDLLASTQEGLEKAIDLLKRAAFREERKGEDHWL